MSDTHAKKEDHKAVHADEQKHAEPAHPQVTYHYKKDAPLPTLEHKFKDQPWWKSAQFY